jgi:putative ABC transport system substrate-binding protein
VGLAIVTACDIPFIAAARARAYRIGYLITSTAIYDAPGQLAFRQGLRDLGYVDGENITIEVRSAEGKEETVPGLVSDLARLGIDVMVVPGNLALTAIERAGITIPVVFYVATDRWRTDLWPAWRGLVATPLDLRRKRAPRLLNASS